MKSICTNMKLTNESKLHLWVNNIGMKDNIEKCEKSMNGMSGGSGNTNAVMKIPQLLSKRNALTQIAIGGLTGLTTGCVAVRLGKTVAAAAGAGILLAQIAHSQGYGNLDWTNIKSKARQATTTIDAKYKNTSLATTTQEISKNKYFVAGFVGGFLLGVST